MLHSGHHYPRGGVYEPNWGQLEGSALESGILYPNSYKFSFQGLTPFFIFATLAAVLATSGDTKGARKALNKANDCDHEKAESLYALAQAQAHAKFGDTDEALRRLKKAVQVDPKFWPRAALDVLFADLRRDGHRFAEAINTGGTVAVGSLECDD